MTTYWALLLHIYQPPWQDIDVLRKVNAECYIPLFSMLERHDNAKITLNIQGCLINMLIENGMQATIDKLKELVKAKKVDVVGTAMYHPILPLIPKTEVNRQIKLNEEVLTCTFGNDWDKRGYFPPEMAVSPLACDYVKDLGYEWMIMSGIANTGDWPTNFIPQQECGIFTFFRDDYTSNEISFKQIDAPQFVQKLNSMVKEKENNYIITAMDGETFGHHIHNYETSFLGKAFALSEDEKDIKIEFISNLKNIFPIKKGPPIRPSSWSTEWSDILSNVPYPLWKHPFNQIHKIQYRILQSLYKLMELLDAHATNIVDNEAFANYNKTARWFYDQALHSCWLWWASMRPMWSPNLIYKGVDLVIKTALNAQLALINIKIGSGDEIYQTIMDNIQKLMNAMTDQELSFTKVRVF